MRNDFAALAAREWLETNGLGGYAAGTVAGAGTRGYHGLLVAATRPPAVRTAIVTTCDEWLVGDSPVYLSTHQYPGAISPEGYRLLESFGAQPFPTWVYRTPEQTVERRVFMVHGENTTVVRYRLLAGRAATLAVRPFFVYRDHHARRYHADHWWVVTRRAGNAVHCAPSDGGPPATVYARGSYREEPLWYRNFEYEWERERGLPFREDACAPFVLELDLQRDTPADVVFTLEPLPPPPPDELEAEERERRRHLTAGVPRGDPVAARLALAADHFLVVGGGRCSVIAGYPWFADWGRDTMIALPGLARAAGAHNHAWQALQDFAAHLRDGVLPNRFPDQGDEPEYNTADASLWMAVAAWRLAEGDSGRGAWRHGGMATSQPPNRRTAEPSSGTGTAVPSVIVQALVEIERCYARGTTFGIHEDDRGLIVAGAPGLALTWMDARVDGWVVTPRAGAPVELSALWYNLRLILAELLMRQGQGDEAVRLRSAAGRTRDGFVAAFLDHETGGLYDVIAPDGTPDAGVRPNQLFALSLPFPLLTRAQGRRVLARVERDLLTPAGLRTLAPGAPGYAGRYGGDQHSRDAAYHQGTVWPWLVGPYADAVRFVEGDTAAAKKKIRAVLASVLELMDRQCVGQLPELAQGDPPHEPVGCPAQAWSLGEVARVWLETTGKREERTGKRKAGRGKSKRGVTKKTVRRKKAT